MAATSADALRLEGVGMRYGRVQALDGITLAVPRGRIFGLIGHNGAGKSTLIKLLLNLIVPTAGRLWVDGMELRRFTRDTRRAVGYLPENLVLYDNLNGLETLRFFAKLKRADVAQCAPLLERVGLSHAGSRPVREYSKGMRQRLGFAQALLGRPRLLLLDEPTTGLDPSATRDFYAQLDALRDDGVTLLVSSHVLAELQDRVDAVAMLANGNLAAQGTVQALREDSGMPLRITATGTAAQIDALPALLDELQRVSGVVIERPAGDRLVVACPRAHKLDVLRVLSAQPLHDLGVREPTLEDVYFGVRRAA